MGPGIDALVTTLTNFGSPVPGGATGPDFPGVQVEWFYNQYPYFKDENNLSLILHLNILGFTFLFPGDMESAGFNNMLQTNARFREVVSSLNVLIASHHGRESGICTDMFDVWHSQPSLVVISDDYKQYNTQNTVNYYNSKCSGVTNFRYAGDNRKVLTTRSDGEILFTFNNGNCIVS